MSSFYQDLYGGKIYVIKLSSYSLLWRVKPGFFGSSCLFLSYLLVGIILVHEHQTVIEVVILWWFHIWMFDLMPWWVGYVLVTMSQPLLRILCCIFRNCEIILSSTSCCCYAVDRGRQDKGVVREEPQLQPDEGVAPGGVWRSHNRQNCHIPRHRQTTRVSVHMDNVIYRAQNLSNYLPVYWAGVYFDKSKVHLSIQQFNLLWLSRL